MKVQTDAVHPDRQTVRGGTESCFEDQRPVLPGNRPNKAVRAIIAGRSRRAIGEGRGGGVSGVRGQPDEKQQQEKQVLD